MPRGGAPLLALALAILATALATLVAQVQARECRAVYNQSGVFICLPVAPGVTTAVGSIVVTPTSPRELNVTVVVFGYSRSFECPVEIRIENASGYPLFSYSATVSSGSVLNLTVRLGEDHDYVVVSGSICNVTVLPFAVLLPRRALSVPTDNPVAVFLASALPIAPLIGFLLRAEAMEGAVAALASLPLVYLLAVHLAPEPARVPTAVVIAFAVSLVIASAFRRHGAA